MSKCTPLIVLVLLTLASLGLSLWAAPRLPERIPSLWTAQIPAIYSLWLYQNEQKQG